MSDKLLLELYERVVALEERVASLEKAADSARTEKPGKKAVSERRGKYRYLSDYLLSSGEDIIELSFGQIEEILQGKLPPSAWHQRTLWANTRTHSIALSWLNVGYCTAGLDMKNETVKFERIKVFRRRESVEEFPRLLKGEF